MDRRQRVEQQRARDQHTTVSEHEIEIHASRGNGRRRKKCVHGIGHGLLIARSVRDQRANAVDARDGVIRCAGGMNRGGEPARHICERIRRIRRRHRARCPQVRQCKHLHVTMNECEPVEPIRDSTRSVHHRRGRCVRHGRHRAHLPVAGSGEKCAQQHALRIVGRGRPILLGAGMVSLTHLRCQDRTQAVREGGDRRISALGCLAQRFRQHRLGLRPRLGPSGGKRQHRAVTDRRQKRALLELEILIVLSREQEIQQRGKPELFASFGCGWRHDAVEQRPGKLRLVVEWHAGARDAGVVCAGPPREREVEQRAAAVAIDEDVPRMNVAVHHATPVQPHIGIEHGDREPEKRHAPLMRGKGPVFHRGHIGGGARAPIQDEIRRLTDHPAAPEPRPHGPIEQRQHGRLVLEPSREVGVRRTTRRLERIPSACVVGDLIDVRVIERVHGTHDGPAIHARARR